MGKASASPSSSSARSPKHLRREIAPAALHCRRKFRANVRALVREPNVTRRAAEAYGFDFRYASRPSWSTYEAFRAFARQIGRDIADLRPRDMIDLQSFIWVLGSDEYPDQR